MIIHDVEMPNNLDQLPVPYEEPRKRRKPPTSGHLLDEVRVLTRPEIKRGRNLLIAICLFLMTLAVAIPASDLAIMKLAQLPIHATRMLVSLVLVVCLLRAVPKVQFFAAIILAASTVICLGLLLWGMATYHISLIVTSAISVIGYGIISLVLAISPSIRGYLGYRRAKRRSKREDRERKDLQRILSYQAEKAQRQ